MRLGSYDVIKWTALIQAMKNRFLGENLNCVCSEYKGESITFNYYILLNYMTFISIRCKSVSDCYE
jgi:hypothetical protein